MSAKPWSVEFERRADKDLDRLDPQVQRRVLGAINRLASDPRSAPLRKLTSRPGWRLRIGDWRVIVELDVKARRLLVLRVLPRGRAYDR